MFQYSDIIKAEQMVHQRLTLICYSLVTILLYLLENVKYFPQPDIKVIIFVLPIKYKLWERITEQSG